VADFRDKVPGHDQSVAIQPRTVATFLETVAKSSPTVAIQMKSLPLAENLLACPTIHTEFNTRLRDFLAMFA